MALITDPDNLNDKSGSTDHKFAADGAITATDATLTSASIGFALGDVGKYVIVEGAGANGSDLVTTIASYTSATEVELTAAASTTVTGSDVTLSGTTEVYIDTSGKTIRLNLDGNLSTDGVTLKALYSFLKEEWKNDPHSKNLPAFPFPMVPITDESFELVDGWDFANDWSRWLIRTGGWTVRNTSGNVTQKWAGIISLGNIDSGGQVYYDQGQGRTNFKLTGAVNQAIQILRDDDGDGVYAEGSDYDRRTQADLYIREYAETYAKATLTDIGVATMDSIVYRYPLSNGSDINVVDTDSNVAANSPFTQVAVRYFSGAYNRHVDSQVTARDFGVVIDVGTHSGIDGSVTASGNTLTTTEGGITGANYAGGTLTVHEGANKGVYTISGTPSATVVTITGTFPSTASNLSFTLQRATPVTATLKQIYTKVQYLLRQASDIDASAGTSIIGNVADSLLSFVGSDLKAGSTSHSNPEGGGTGVIIEGFAAADTNNLTFYDNSDATRTYPFVASLTINFGANFQSDADSKYWVYFTTLPGGSNDWGEAGAVVVDDASGNDIAGDANVSSVTKTFDYDNNVQGGRTSGTDAGITVVGIGLGTGQYVRTTGTIERSTTNVVSLVPALERNYQNI